MWLKKKNQKTLWLDYPAAEVIWTEMDKLISHKIKKQPQELKFPFFLSLNEEEQLNLLLVFTFLVSSRMLAKIQNEAFRSEISSSKIALSL